MTKGRTETLRAGVGNREENGVVLARFGKEVVVEADLSSYLILVRLV